MKTLDLTELLRSNPYPGRGIVLGRSADDTKAVIAYFIMGRSENSRNRVFVETPDGIRTQAFDPSKMTDPSLIIYNPVRVFGASTIVTNGDQTDTIREGLAAGKTFSQALHTRTFEPDEPNYTPRISGLVKKDGDYVLSILKSADGDPASCRRYFFTYEKPLAGQGHFIHTYMGDGNPLPSFEGEPEQITIDSKTPQEFAQLIWSNLNEDNKVSLFVRYIDLMTGDWETVILNKHQ
ncbi:IMP cyclohydrolase [Flavonifractor sp. An82]|uniref:IMP cyclohydrolase n=1 Tax=Flavonifractor sp. An82 TaxID=1965660 RepID=UPI000B3AC19D|nr:IMP cyclohydrolase [Flavonifractor sp. An82]OUN20879.1 inosine monophosphate cyclohydrolase [Flavonifractor sp. An82]